MRGQANFFRIDELLRIFGIGNDLNRLICWLCIEISSNNRRVATSNFTDFLQEDFSTFPPGCFPDMVEMGVKGKECLFRFPVML